MIRKVKVSFLCGSYRFVSFDELCIDGEFLSFNLKGETELTCVTRNVVYFERFQERGEGWEVGKS